MSDKTSVDKINEILFELGLTDREVTNVYSLTSDTKGIKKHLAISWIYKENKGSSILLSNLYKIDIKNGETYKQAFNRHYKRFK